MHVPSGSQNPRTGFNFLASVSKSSFVSESLVLLEEAVWHCLVGTPYLFGVNAKAPERAIANCIHRLDMVAVVGLLSK
jgi:hypothetical protein